MEGQLTILVANRNRLFAEALAALFQELAEHAELAITGSHEDTVAAAGRLQPDLVVLDAWLDRSDPAASVAGVLAVSPRSKVFVLMTDVDPALEVRLIEAGAAGCHAKEGLDGSAHAMLAGLRSGS